VLSAVAFTGCFDVTRTAVLLRANDWFVETERRQTMEAQAAFRRGEFDYPTSREVSLESRTISRMDRYGIGSRFHSRWEFPGEREAMARVLPVFFFAPLCLLLAGLMLGFCRARMQIGPLDDDWRTFQFRMVTRLAVPVLVLATAAGALAAAGLSGVRLLQIRYQPHFNDSWVSGENVFFYDDYLGNGVATLISCAAMLAVVTWGIYPYFARRTLRQLGRCAKCAYPRGDNTTCPECGSSHA
ncbi:MAG TPA: hypothetical protein VK157_03330, partial [Phycisphaerales bacterium]|nr:hypothetical protein [Phycisphaerales bacterium]